MKKEDSVRYYQRAMLQTAIIDTLISKRSGYTSAYELLMMDNFLLNWPLEPKPDADTFSLEWPPVAKSRKLFALWSMEPDDYDHFGLTLRID